MIFGGTFGLFLGLFVAQLLGYAFHGLQNSAVRISISVILSCVFGYIGLVLGGKKALSFWQCPPAEKEFLPYAEALTAYKEKLWTIGKPRNKKRRYVHTLSGRKIEADRGKSAHRGQVLSWQIQGTVADILNAACLKIIGLESSKHWKLCFPVHDAAYVIGTPEQAAEIGAIMETEAKRLKQPLSVEIKTYKAGI